MFTWDGEQPPTKRHLQKTIEFRSSPFEFLIQNVSNKFAEGIEQNSTMRFNAAAFKGSPFSSSFLTVMQ